ncbi:MAG: efflux RND transporter permease subunit [bacterium]|nr:efflux RND transporter permease subunit [bacterium]
MNLAEKSIKRPVSLMMIFLCFVVVGVISAKLLPLEYFPDTDFPNISVNIPYPNSTPEEAERQIIRPIEEVLATISGIKRMRSSSGANYSTVSLEFKWGTNSNLKAIEAREKIDTIRSQLPADIERIFVEQFSSTDKEMLKVRLSSKRDLSNSYDMLDRHIKRRIERLDGVSRVTLYGVEKKEIRIRLMSNRVIAHQVDLSRLAGILTTSNFMVTAGKITDGKRRFTVRPIGELKTPEEIGNLVVGKNNLKLKDIAKITHEQPILTNGRHLNRKYAIGLDVFKETGANAVEVSELVKAEIERIKRDPKLEGINLFFLEDMAEGIISSLDELTKSGLIGGLLALIVLFFFLRQWTSTLIVALSVPFSLLVTLACMYFLGISLNILSMLGLLLAVGMLVDNAVVITENIYRHQKIHNGSTTTRHTILAVNEVTLAITAGTLTTAIVFLPNIIRVSSEIMFYLKHIGVAFCVALGASLLIAQTLVPLLTSKLKPTHRERKKNAIDRLATRYKKILTWLLDHRRTSIVIIFITLFSVAIPAMFVKSDMFPEQGDRRLRLFYNINDSYKVSKVEGVVNKVEKYLFENKDKFEIDSVYTYYQYDYAESTIILKKGDEAVKAQKTIKNEITEGLPTLAMAAPAFERSGGGSGEKLRIRLVGPSTEKLIELSQQAAWMLGNIDGFQSVRSEAGSDTREVVVTVDRHRARKAGFTSGTIADSIAVAMRGVRLRPLQSDEGETAVWVEFQKKDKRSQQQLQNITLFNDSNQPVKLASLANFKVRQGSGVIRRENRVTAIGISMDLKDLTVNEAKEKIKPVMEKFKFPAGYTWNYGRSFDFEAETMKTMLINMALALALIYFVMASLFESLLFPGAIWVSIIFAIIGVYWFFLLTGTTFSFMAQIGILVLIGVVVNNGIVLIDYINRLRSQGLARNEAIIQAGFQRLRPILMTAGTTVFSLIPLCIAATQIGGDGPAYFPMARAIAGGLTFSTLVTLLILPTIYILLDDLRNWGRRLVRTAGKSQ